MPKSYKFKFENKKNQINVIAFKTKITVRKIYANFLPINAVSGSSLTLISFPNNFVQDNIIYKIDLSNSESWEKKLMFSIICLN